jgi:hypothetical protein
MRFLNALLFLIISAPVATGVNAGDDVDVAGVCSSTTSSSSSSDGTSTCTEPELLTEPTNDAVDSPIHDAYDDYDDDTDGEDANEEEEDADEGDDDEDQFECIDKDDKCPTYAEANACIDNPGYMTYHCAASCNTCEAVRDAERAAQFVKEGTVSSPCMDDHYQCSEWAGMGECDNNPV